MLSLLGDATIEATILAVNFPNLTTDYNVDDDDKDAMFSFIQCYCKGCSSPAVASPQDTSILFCPHCHLDPQRRQTSTLEWYYPLFEMTLTDRVKNSRVGASLSVEMLQVRCQMELGNQVFPTVPADQWMSSSDESQFWKCRDWWVKIMEHLNNSVSLELENDDQDDQDEDEDEKKERELRRKRGQELIEASGTKSKRVKVDVRVGLNFAAKALKIHYL